MRDLSALSLQILNDYNINFAISLTHHYLSGVESTSKFHLAFILIFFFSEGHPKNWDAHSIIYFHLHYIELIILPSKANDYRLYLANCHCENLISSPTAVNAIVQRLSSTWLI